MSLATLTSLGVSAAFGASAAAVIVTGGDVDALRVGGYGESIAQAPVPCCADTVPTPVAAASDPSVRAAGVVTVAGQVVPASAWRIVEVPAPQLLPVGLAPERGLQIRTILVSRSITREFPEIVTIAGVRRDALRWHPDGLALDVMIPNPGSAAGIALGDEIVTFVLKNAKRFGLQDAIWRDVYYTPGGVRASGYGHYDHVHITTTGGGYPTDGESYYR